jgi:glyoxylase-like metal-dependent hydrolase (beta-lactamase superfamily II)
MLRTTLLTATLSLALNGAQAAQPLQIKVYHADDHSFNVNSTLIYGEKEAMVIDAGFTRADALRIAANVIDSGKELKTIFVSQADPDYYFGVETLKQFFPQAEVLATPAVLSKLSAKMAAKLAFWGPKMGGNAPQHPVLPAAYQATSLSLDGQTIEIRGTEGLLAHRPYLWIPSIKAIVGNIAVFNNLHVWTADTQTLAERQAWSAQLEQMDRLKPLIVVPGHMRAGSAMDASAISYTRNYLSTFEKQASTAKDSLTLINSMKLAYPEAEGMLSLEIGAKVNQGEMKW